MVCSRVKTELIPDSRSCEVLCVCLRSETIMEGHMSVFVCVNVSVDIP